MAPYKYLIPLITLLLLSVLTSDLQGANAQPAVLTVSPTVSSDYQSIAIALTAASPGDTIVVRAGVYFESITVSKSITIVGEDPKNTFIRGSNPNGVAINITADSVNIFNFSIRNIALTTPAVEINHARNVTIANNTITNSPIGMLLSSASNSIIANNTLTANTYALLTDSYTHDNILYQNNIVNNTLGLNLAFSYNNTFYHNNFINNTAFVSGKVGNNWDNGYPDGGNYWSNFVGADQYLGIYQNITGKDGLSDTQYSLAGSDIDRYPLMHPYSGLVGDLNKDNAVNFDDLLYFVRGWASVWSSNSVPSQYKVCDLDPDGVINIVDLLLFSKAFAAYNQSIMPS